MDNKQMCIVLTLTDGRRSRILGKFLQQMGVEYCIFPRDRMALVPCTNDADSSILLSKMPFGLYRTISSAYRSPDFKALLWRRVRGVSPYDSYYLIVTRAKTQGALVSDGLLNLVVDVHGGRFL